MDYATCGLIAQKVIALDRYRNVMVRHSNLNSVLGLLYNRSSYITAETHLSSFTKKNNNFAISLKDVSGSGVELLPFKKYHTLWRTLFCLFLLPPKISQIEISPGPPFLSFRGILPPSPSRNRFVNLHLFIASVLLESSGAGVLHVQLSV